MSHIIRSALVTLIIVVGTILTTFATVYGAIHNGSLWFVPVKILIGGGITAYLTGVVWGD